jgi:HYDIN/CFA65/VesB family protein
MKKPALVLAAALLAAALFPAAGHAEEGGGPPGEAPQLSFPQAPLDLGKVTVGTESTTVTVAVHNSGIVPASINKVTLEGGDAGEFKLGGSNCGWLEPGLDCTVDVAVSPGSMGVKQTELVVVLNEFPAQTMAVSATAVPAQIAYTPGSHDFGIQRTNESTSTLFQLTNTGEAFIQVGSTGIGGHDTGNFWTDSSDCWNGRRLDPGESCNVRVYFNAWNAVEYEAEVQAYANGATAGAALTGTGGSANLQPEANPIALGDATVGAAGSVHTIHLANTGNISGGYFIGVIAGGDAGSFELLDETCTGRMLAPADTCVAHVRLAPLSVGPKVARLAFFGDGEGGTLVQIEGNGVAPALTLLPEAWDFGPLAPGTRGQAHAFAVRNDGADPLDLDAVSLTDADPDQFVVSGDECSDSTLAPGAECLVRVRFAPDGPGLKAARLRVGSDAGPLFAELSGGELTATGQISAESLVSAAGSPTSRSRRHRGRRHRFSRGDAIVSQARVDRVAQGAQPSRR